MKITKTYLKQIIKEELERLDEAGLMDKFAGSSLGQAVGMKTSDQKAQQELKNALASPYQPSKMSIRIDWHGSRAKIITSGQIYSFKLNKNFKIPDVTTEIDYRDLETYRTDDSNARRNATGRIFQAWLEGMKTSLKAALYPNIELQDFNDKYWQYALRQANIGG